MAAPPHSAEVAVLCRCVASLLHCRYEEEAAGAAGGMMAKFLAARAKQDSRPGQSQSKKPARTLRTFDPTSGGGGGGGGGGESDDDGEVDLTRRTDGLSTCSAGSYVGAHMYM